MAQSDGTLIFDTKIITDGFKKGISSIGATAIKGVGAISTAFAAASGATLKFSGELEQNLGGSEAVFKEYAKNVQTAADTAFKNMGLSTSDFLSTANKMGALFQGSGFDIAESAELSAKTMQRAADVASIMGIDVSFAMESIAGAAKGNFTMMDNLGVAMNDTTLGAYALEKGINKSTRAMTNQEKIGLAMQMFLEKTEYAAGNYAKENETLAGALTTAKAALENFLSGTGDPADLADSLSAAAEVVVEKLGELTPKLASGLSEVFADLAPMVPSMLKELISAVLDGANELAVSFGDMFSEIVTIAAQCGPDIVEAGVQLIESFANGIINNTDEIASAAVKIGEALISALIEIIPKVLDTAGQIVSAFANELGKAVPLVKPLAEAVKFLAENIDVCVVAFASWKAAFVIQGVLSTASVAIKKITTAVKGATTAQELWNLALKANKLTLVASAAAALAAGIYIVTKRTSESNDTIGYQINKIDELNKKLEEQTEKWNDIKSVQRDAQQATESQMHYIQDLSNELKTLADESGKVQEKDEARAQFILTQLNKALGTEYTMVDGVIQKYGELSQSIDTLIAKKTAEAILETKEEGFKTALTDRDTNKDELAKAKQSAQALKDEMLAAEKAVDAARAALEKWETTPSNYNRPNSALTSAITAAETNYERAQAAYDKANQSVDAWEAKVSETENTINDYWLTQQAILEGNYDAVYNGSYKTAQGATDGTAQALKDGSGNVRSTASEIADDTANSFSPLPEKTSYFFGDAASRGVNAFSDGVSDVVPASQQALSGLPGTFSQMGDFAASSFGAAVSATIPNTQQALAQLPAIINDALGSSIQSASVQGSDLIFTMQDGMTQTIPNAVSTAEGGGQLIIDGLAVANSLAPQTGADYVNGVIRGLESKRGALIATALSLASAMNIAVKVTGWNEHSPSKVAEENGEYYGEGLGVGLDKSAKKLDKKATNLAKGMNEAFKAEVGINSPATCGIENGEDYIEGVEVGIETEAKNLEKAAADVAEGMNDAFIAAASSKISEIRAAISSISGAIQEEDKNKKEAFDSEAKMIEMLKDFGIDSEETYYSKLEFLRDNYLTQYSDAWIDATQKIYDYQQDLAEKAAKEAEKAAKEAAEEAEKAAKKAQEAREAAQQKELDTLKRKLDRGMISEHEYYAELARLRDEFYEFESDVYYELDDEIFEYNKRLFEEEKEAIKDVYSEISEFITGKLDDILEKQKSFGEKLIAGSHLYENVTINAGDDSMQFYRLNDLTDELENAKAYRELLTQVVDRVKASGASEDAIAGILNQIDELGNDEEGLGYLNSLLGASDSDFGKYMSTYAELIATKQGTAIQRYSGEMADAVDESYQYMVDELTKAGLEIPEGFFLSGTLSAEKFGEAFMQELELQLQEIQTRIIDFNTKHGNSLGVGSQNVNNDNRSTTYNIYGDSPSTVSQIKNYETIKRLSGQ